VVVVEKQAPGEDHELAELSGLAKRIDEGLRFAVIRKRTLTLAYPVGDVVEVAFDFDADPGRHAVYLQSRIGVEGAGQICKYGPGTEESGLAGGGWCR
jgi:hypothetical protein